MTAPCIVGEGLNPSDEMDSYDNDYQMQHKTITIINKVLRAPRRIRSFTIVNKALLPPQLKPRIDSNDV